MAAAAFSRAHDVKDVVSRELLRPEQLTGIQVKSQDSVAGLRVRLGEIVSGAGVNYSALGIDGGSGPDTGAGGPPVLHARRGFGGWVRFLRNGVSLPNLLAGGGIQRHQRSAGGAAFIFITEPDFLASGHGHEHAAIMV